MSVRLSIDLINELHSYINDKNGDEYSGYIYIKDDTVKFIRANKSEYIDKPLPFYFFYDYLSFHTHPKKEYTGESIQDIPSYKDILFVKNTILNKECPGHVLFTPYYIYYITIDKKNVSPDNYLKKIYYETIQNEYSPSILKSNLKKGGILINYTPTKNYTSDIFLKKYELNKDNYDKNKLHFIFFLVIIVIFLFLFICLLNKSPSKILNRFSSNTQN